jgi:hypothetical protein
MDMIEGLPTPDALTVSSDTAELLVALLFVPAKTAL